MSNTATEWLKIIVPALSGGAVGALITAIITNRRNRIQTVGKSVNHKSLFAQGNLLKDHVTKITLTGDSGDYHFDNLHLVQIELQNNGNKDYSNFKFGVTLPDKSNAISVQGLGADRHHTLSIDQQIQFSTPSNIIDLNLKPFNRKDVYQLTLYVTNEGNKTNFNDVKFSSELPISFKETKASSSIDYQVITIEKQRLLTFIMMLIGLIVGVVYILFTAPINKHRNSQPNIQQSLDSTGKLK